MPSLVLYKFHPSVHKLILMNVTYVVLSVCNHICCIQSILICTFNNEDYGICSFEMIHYYCFTPLCLCQSDLMYCMVSVYSTHHNTATVAMLQHC